MHTQTGKQTRQEAEHNAERETVNRQTEGQRQLATKQLHIKQNFCVTLISVLQIKFICSCRVRSVPYSLQK